jgi:hypothetical protein
MRNCLVDPARVMPVICCPEAEMAVEISHIVDHRVSKIREFGRGKPPNEVLIHGKVLFFLEDLGEKFGQVAFQYRIDRGVDTMQPG